MYSGDEASFEVAEERLRESTLRQGQPTYPNLYGRTVKNATTYQAPRIVWNG